LDETEVARRRIIYGENRLTFSQATPGWLVFIKQFKTPMIMILLGAAIITALLQDWVDMGAILLALLMNAVIGTWQELKAQAEVRALASSSKTYSQVLRDGILKRLLSQDLVPGD